jgi:hypothetical protein
MEEQFGALAQNPDILVATPGRLMHHLSEVEGMSLRSVEYVVFDEADRLFEMGFAEQLRSILHHLADSRQVRARAGLRERLHMFFCSKFELACLNHHPHFMIRQTVVPSVANGHRLTKWSNGAHF